MGSIAPFRLKAFFNDDPGPSARYNLSPSFCEPLTIRDLLALNPGAADAFECLTLGYPGIHGSRQLRELIAQRYQGLTAEQVVVTCGSDNALALALLACLEQGDHVVVHSPGYQPFTSLAKWLGCAVSRWWAREDAGWALDLAELPGLVNAATRMIVVNLPHNPTGYVMPARELGHLLAFAAERNIVVLCDEVYEDLALDGAPVPGRAAMLSPHAISISGLSKNFGLPGLRVGWIATQNQAVLRAVTQLHRHGNSYASAPSEFLAALALTNSAAIVGRNRSIAVENLRAVRAFMAHRQELITWQEPRAGVVGFPHWSGPETAAEFCAHLLAATGVLVAPGAYFDGDDAHLRIGFGLRNVPAILAIVDDYLSDQYGS